MGLFDDPNLQGQPVQAPGQQPSPLNFAQPSPAPQQQGPDLIALLSALGGLGLNIAGAATGAGAAGNGALAVAGQRQDDVAKSAEKKAKLQKEADERAGVEKQALSMFPRVQELKDPKAQEQATVALQNRDLSTAQRLIDQQRSDDRFQQEQQKYYATLNRQDKRFDARDALNLEGSLSKSLKELDAGRDPSVKRAVELRDAVSATVDPAKGFDLAEFRLRNPKIKLKEDEATALESIVNEQVQAANQTTGVGKFFGRGKTAEGKKAPELFGDLHKKLANPEALEKEDARSSRKGKLEENLGAVRWVRANLNSKDPKVQAKVQTVLNALRMEQP